MKKIIIYTNLFPYNKYSESFLMPELEYASRNNIDITIVPTVKDSYIREIPENIKLDNCICNASFKHKIICLLKVLSLPFIKVLRENKDKDYSIKYIYDKYKYLYGASLILQDITNRVNCGDNYVFYSYWLTYCPIAFAIYKSIHPRDTQNVFLSRGHGSDIYSVDIGVYFPLRRYSISHLNHLYVISDYGTQYLIDKFPEYSNIISRSRLGVFDNYDSSKYINTNDNVIKIVSCASVIPTKRIDLLYKSLLNYANKYPERQIEWTHFGGGILFDSIERLISNNNTPNLRVDLKGAIDNQDVIQNYQMSSYSCFISVSETEGIPVSMMEAISFNIPILSTDVGGVKEIVNSNTGRLIPKLFTQKDFDDNLDFILRNKDNLNVREFYLKEYSADKNFGDFYNSIKSL